MNVDVSASPWILWAAIATGIGAIGFAFVRTQSIETLKWWQDWLLQRRRGTAQLAEVVESKEIRDLKAAVQYCMDQIQLLRTEQRRRDDLIRHHVEWDHKMIVIATRHGFAHLLTEPPPLYPDPADDENAGDGFPS